MEITVENRARSAERRLLIAVLLNRPKSTSGARTRNAVAAAARVLRYQSVEVVNMYSDATSSMGELNRSATIDGWVRARRELSSALGRATVLLAQPCRIRTNR
jgi:type IV secretory pathway VirB6-like protein